MSLVLRRPPLATLSDMLIHSDRRAAPTRARLPAHLAWRAPLVTAPPSAQPHHLAVL